MDNASDELHQTYIILHDELLALTDKFVELEHKYYLEIVPN